MPLPLFPRVCEKFGEARRPTPPPIRNPLERVPGPRKRGSPLSRKREDERHIPLRYSRSRYHRPSDSQPFPPLSKRFFVRHFLSYSFQFSRNSNVSSQKRRFMIEKIQIRKQRSGNVRDGKGWKEADPKQGFGGNPRPHGWLSKISSSEGGFQGGCKRRKGGKERRKLASARNEEGGKERREDTEG